MTADRKGGIVLTRLTAGLHGCDTGNPRTHHVADTHGRSAKNLVLGHCRDRTCETRPLLSAISHHDDLVQELHILIQHHIHNCITFDSEFVVCISHKGHDHHLRHLHVNGITSVKISYCRYGRVVLHKDYSTSQRRSCLVLYLTGNLMDCFCGF